MLHLSNTSDQLVDQGVVADALSSVLILIQKVRFFIFDWRFIGF